MLTYSIYFYITTLVKKMITVEELRDKIITLVNNEIINEKSDLYQKIASMANPIINSLIGEDNENDINWDELNELFEIYNDDGYVKLDKNNLYVNIDEKILNTGEEYTLKYVDEYNNELTSFDKITTFIA